MRDRKSPEDFSFLDYEEPLFRDLIDHPAIVPRLRDIMSVGREHAQAAQQFYLSHWYIISRVAGEDGIWFHNGGVPHSPLCSYSVQDGKMFSGLTAVIWALTDAAPGDGGFWCIPGSHKASFAVPTAIERCEHIPECVFQPALPAGSALIFTEALTHGMRPWRAAHERIALFYKYEPAHLVFPLTYTMPASWVASMSARHRRYFRPQLGTREQEER